MFFQDLPPPPPVVAQDDAPGETFLTTNHRLENETAILIAGREPVRVETISDSYTLFDSDDVLALDSDQLVELVRLAPSASISQTGPNGTQAQLRIRGAEASHTLLFVNGIKANDPAAGNEARFELLSGTSFDYVQIVRGPQSATWGSEAIGGVVALQTRSPYNAATLTEAQVEIGTAGYDRVTGAIGTAGDAGSIIIDVGHQGSNGFDSFGDDGDLDGYSQLTGRLMAHLKVSDELSLYASAFGIDGRSEFDGFDPLTFQRADTLDETDNQLGAGRIAANYWRDGFEIEANASLLASRNINFLDDAEQNRTSAERLTVGAQASYNFYIGKMDHTIIMAVDREEEDFSADDIAFGGFTTQDVGRSLTAFIAEYRLETDAFSIDAAIRHDDFSDFANATTFSAGARVPFGDVILTANYGEGIAQPSFYDLFGFFPGSFVGNPDVMPERSRGGDVGLRYDHDEFGLGITLFTQELTDEIVSTFDVATFLSSVENGDGKSHRRGIEIEGDYALSDTITIAANYSYLDATDPEAPNGTKLAEVRRPSHRAAIILTGGTRLLTYGASLAIVGERFDTDFDVFPAERVTLGTYALASARIAYAVNDTIEISLRGSNLLDADYQDVIGYNTQGRTVFVGLRLTP
ncbi:MAG: TonB-dependent receptor [Sphingomonas sp.]|nr:TonB-dependent receptor [Sphingomonas sp.]RZV50976.1 MAG: TonB-dependent receptor [Sphingomonadaceae bacterium]